MWCFANNARCPSRDLDRIEAQGIKKENETHNGRGLSGEKGMPYDRPKHTFYGTNAEAAISSPSSTTTVSSVAPPSPTIVYPPTMSSVSREQGTRWLAIRVGRVGRTRR